MKQHDTLDLGLKTPRPDPKAEKNRVPRAPAVPSGWEQLDEIEAHKPTEEMRDTSLGLGVPGPSFGGDTQLDPSFELEPEAPTRRIEVGKSTRDDLLSLAGPHSDPDSNDALDLVSRVDMALDPSISGSLVPPVPPRQRDPMSELRERYALGDFSGALTIAEGMLEDDPDNGDAQRYAESCRDVLRQMYAARLGALSQVPTVTIPGEQLRWLTLDHRSGFLLSHVDGVSTLEEILDVSGMNPLDAMRIIWDLLQQKVIALR